MANEINITVGATETVSSALEGVGDAARRQTNVVVQAMGDNEDAFDTAARGASRFGDALGKAEGGGMALTDGMDGLATAIQGVTDLSRYSAQRADDQARKYLDVEQAAADLTQALVDTKQATRDLSQSQLDTEQATLDQSQALLDAEQAQKDYNKAVKEHGANSAEAKQASQDLQQAQLDLKQAQEDAAQAALDGEQALVDQTQAGIDARSAAVDLNEAQRNAQPPNGIQKFGDMLTMITPILAGLVGIIGAITAVQWAWNAAMVANPIGLIIAGIVLLIGVIVFIAVKTTWFQDLWNWVWSKIGDPVKAVGDFILSYWKFMFNLLMGIVEWVVDRFVTAWRNGTRLVVQVFDGIKIGINAFKTAVVAVADAISSAYRGAFNRIASAWNSTVGRLSFSLPEWVPGIGGRSFSAPRLPTLATGGEVLRSGMAIIHKGERVMPAGTRGLSDMSTSGGGVFEFKGFIGAGSGSAIAELLNMLLETGQLQWVAGDDDDAVRMR